jgi:hypothetical protein
MTEADPDRRRVKTVDTALDLLGHSVDPAR